MEDDGGSFWASPMRTLRVPMGFVFVAAAVVLVLVGGAYSIGYSRGAEKERAEAIRRAFGDVTPVDPLAGTNPGGGEVRQPAQGTRVQTAPPPQQGTPAEAQNRSSGARSGAEGSGDPRVEGLNYFHVARVFEEEANQIASFLNANGVAAAVVPSNNARLRIVVASQGYPRGEIYGAEANALKAEIRRLGRLYKAQENGSTDFSGMYAVRFPD